MRKQHQERLQHSRNVAPGDHRREERIDLKLSIEVCGFDSSLRFFTERTETRNVSGWGCQFPLRVDVPEEAVLAIRLIRQNGDGESTTKSALFRVVRVCKESEGTFVQAQKMQPYDLWDIDVPLLN